MISLPGWHTACSKRVYSLFTKISIRSHAERGNEGKMNKSTIFYLMLRLAKKSYFLNEP